MPEAYFSGGDELSSGKSNRLGVKVNQDWRPRAEIFAADLPGAASRSPVSPIRLDAKKTARERSLVEALGPISVGDVVRIAVVANGHVGLVPLFLGGAASVGLEGGLIGKLHHKNGRPFTLNLDGLGPDMGNPRVGGGQGLDAVQGRLDLRRSGLGLPFDGDDMNHGFWGGLSEGRRSAEGQQAGGEEGGEELFHDAIFEGDEREG